MITDVRSVAIIPGDTQLARIVGAYSRAAVAVRFTTPALAALYGASPWSGRVALRVATVTRLPAPASSRIGMAARSVWNDAVEVHADDEAPLLVGVLVQRLVAADAGVGDHVGEPAHRVGRRVHGRGGGVGIGDVGGERMAADLLGDGRGALAVAVEHRHLRAARGEEAARWPRRCRRHRR